MNVFTVSVLLGEPKFRRKPAFIQHTAMADDIEFNFKVFVGLKL